MGDRGLAAWLIANRRPIEARLRATPGAAPPPASPEAEALRRFRSFAAAGLGRGAAAPPSLDGLKLDAARLRPVLAAWCDAAAAVAGPRGAELRNRLERFSVRFLAALGGTSRARRARGVPRTGRRAVIAAIDRVAEAFLAVDTDDGTIADANPAAGALLGVARDALIGQAAFTYVPPQQHDAWWTALGAAAEGDDGGRLRTALVDAAGAPVPVDASITRYASRGRTLALIVARPSGTPSAGA